jgi:hypothetical protein
MLASVTARQLSIFNGLHPAPTRPGVFEICVTAVPPLPSPFTQTPRSATLTTTRPELSEGKAR